MKRIKFRMAGLLAVLMLLLSAGGSAWADPSISFNNLSISQSSPFNSIRAVCSPETNITVTVDIVPTYDAAGTCLNTGGSPAVKREATGSGGLSALSASDGTNSCTLLNTVGNTYACDLGVRPEGGPYTVTVSATATDTNTDTSCTANGVNLKSPTKTSSTSTKYVTDKEAPTMRVASYSPGNLQITAGGSIGINVKLKDGSSGTPYSFNLSGYNNDGTVGPALLDGYSFGGPSGPNDNGKDPNENSKDLALQTSCTTTPGIYTMRVEANTEDLCGNPFATIVKDPAGTTLPNGAAGGNNEAGTFEVLPAVQLNTTTHIVGPLPPNGDYNFEQCFTSTSNRRKLITNPGSAHIAAVVNATVPDSCEVTTISNPIVKLTLPVGFSFLLTGGSPAAHVFVGEATGGFDFHDPDLDGLAEVTDAATITGEFTQTITVDLSNVDVGAGPGQIPTSHTIYVRAHNQYTGPGVAPSNAQYVFTTEAGADGGLTASDTETLIGNPTGGCSPDGVLPG